MLSVSFYSLVVLLYRCNRRGAALQGGAQGVGIRQLDLNDAADHCQFETKP